MYLCMCVCDTYVCTMYICINMYACMYVCMHVCLRVCGYVCMHHFCSITTNMLNSVHKYLCNFITKLHSVTNWASAESYCSCCTVLTCYSNVNWSDCGLSLEYQDIDTKYQDTFEINIYIPKHSTIILTRTFLPAGNRPPQHRTTHQEKHTSTAKDPQRWRTNQQHKKSQRVHKTKAINVEISTSDARNARIST